MKKFLTNTILLLGIFISNASIACETCKINQPKITRNLVHGVGPESNWDWFIVGFVVLLTILSLFLSIKYLLKPGEKNSNHIKYSLFINNLP